MLDPSSMMQQAEAYLRAGQHDRAEACAEELLRRAPGHTDALNLSAYIRLLTGRLPEAIERARRAVELDASKPEYRMMLGGLLAWTHQSEEAIPILEQVIAERPTQREPYANLVAAYANAGRFIDSENIAARALELFPGDIQMLTNVAMATHHLGNAENVLGSLYQVVQANPHSIAAAAAYAVMCNYAPAVPARQVADAHRYFGQLSANAALPAPWGRNYLGSPDPERPLRVGFISPDLRIHSVASFIEPLLAALPRDRVEVFVYYTAADRDAVNERLRTYPTVWRDVDQMPTASLAAGIHGDAIDVLIELSGLTDGFRLDVLAMRPAPIQVSYMGYPATTGCDFVDYRLVDSLTDPVAETPGAPGAPPSADELCTERLIRMEPPFLCFRPNASSPPPRPPIDPASTGPITFGCFGPLRKYSERLVYLWAQVMNAVPNSRLLIKALSSDDPRIRDRVVRRFGMYGLDPSRIEMTPSTPGAVEHLTMYHRVDIALDTFPYHGTTTTCEALYMGVPSVSLIGQTHVSRVGLTLLSAVGLAELTATTEAGYISAAKKLAEDRPRLAHLHATLRETFIRSPLADEAGFAARFESTLRGLWKDCLRASTNA